MPDKYTSAQFAAKIKEREPKLAAMPDDQLVKEVLRRRPDLAEYVMDVGPALPQGTVSKPPTGVAGVKARGYEAATGFADWIKRNFPTIGGTLGGVVGLTGGPLGSIAGASLGGSAGKAVEQIVGFSEGKPQTTNLGAVSDIALGGLEQGLYEAGGASIAKLGKAISPASRASLLAYGARAGELGPKLERLLPDLDKVIAQSGGQAPKNIAQLEGLAKATERNLNTEFSIALQPVAGQQILPMTVSKAIRDKITPNLAKTPQGRATEAYLKRRALDFESQTWTIQQLNAERELITKRLRAWHNAVASGQVAQARVESNIAADTAAEQALKDLIYDAADRSGAKPPGYFRELKQRQSDLITLMDSIDKNKERLAKATMEREGGPLTEKIHVRGYAHPMSGTPGGVLGLSPSMFSNPAKQSSKAIQKAFPGTQWQKAARIVRDAMGKGLSREEANALALRVLGAEVSKEESAP